MFYWEQAYLLHNIFLQNIATNFSQGIFSSWIFFFNQIEPFCEPLLNSSISVSAYTLLSLLNCSFSLSKFWEYLDHEGDGEQKATLDQLVSKGSKFLLKNNSQNFHLSIFKSFFKAFPKSLFDSPKQMWCDIPLLISYF